MKIIGITGPSGAGKSLLCHSLSDNNIPCIDADSVYHDLLLPPSDCLCAIRRAFGSDVFFEDGGLDRAALGAVVFCDREKLELLNRTVLGYVLDDIRRMISDYGERGYSVVAVDAPTLIESGFHKECTAVISVLAPEKKRLDRIMKRDVLSLERAQMRIRSQKSDEFYREYSDIILENDSTLDSFKLKIKELIKGDVFAPVGTEGADG